MNATTHPYRKGDAMTERLYHIIAINERTGRRVTMTGYPMNHHDCCTMMRKITRYPWRRLLLEETHPELKRVA